MSWFDSILKYVGLSSSSIPFTSAIISDIDNITKALTFLRPLGAEFAAFHTAWLEKDLQAEIIGGLDISEAILNAASIVYPPASAAAKGLQVIEMLVPIIVPALIRFGADLVPDGRGGWVSQAWIDNKRHQLNRDGSFRF